MIMLPVLVVALFGCMHHSVSGQGAYGPYGNSSSNQYGRGYGNAPVSTQYNTGVSSDADLPNHSHNFPTPNQGCFPNIIATPVAADPLSRLGRYYEYRLCYKDGQAYNAQFTTKVVNQGLKFLPGTYTPIVHTVQDDYRWITLGNPPGYGSGSGSGSGAGGGYGSSPAGYASGYKEQVKCNYNFIDIWSRYDGVDIYELFDPENGPTNPIPQVVYLLYLEPGERGWEIQYQCDQANEKTYKCDKATIYVNTRVRPDYLSKEEQYRIDDTINRVLAPYCMSTNDLQKVIFRDDLSIEQCNLTPLEAFRNLVIGADRGLPDRAGGAVQGRGQGYGQGQAYAAPRAY